MIYQYPKDVLRCQHIKVNGTQCGSPALKNQPYCFFHQANRPQNLCLERSAAPPPPNLTLPVLEDANSVQVAVMQVIRLFLAGQIDAKATSLTLYAMQIASSNLARLSLESDRATRVVIDPERVAETPLGRHPWSVFGVGHDPENEENMPQRPESNPMSRILLYHLGLKDEDMIREMAVLPEEDFEASRQQHIADEARAPGVYLPPDEEKENEKQFQDVINPPPEGCEYP
ncbi:MAG TPA: hypothetical protein VF753_19175 [Terriglobales bacterium]